MKAVQQAAYIIHTRPYRESSFIVELFSREFGRLACVAKGARRARRGPSLPQPFVPMLASWVGRGPLFTLTNTEVQADTGGINLEGDYLVGGLYLNELVMRLLEPGDTHSGLFDGYAETLTALARCAPMSVALRKFEYLLLRECGYAPDFTVCAATGEPIDPTRRYKLVVDEGFRRVEGETQGMLYDGEAVLAVARGDYALRANRRAALHIFRALLENHLGERGLVSRSLLSAGRN